jgi:hypothetical protein
MVYYIFKHSNLLLNIESEIIARLFGVLTKNGHFSHQRYLQRLIVRGDVRPEKRSSEVSINVENYFFYNISN